MILLNEGFSPDTELPSKFDIITISHVFYYFKEPHTRKKVMDKLLQLLSKLCFNKRGG